VQHNFEFRVTLWRQFWTPAHWARGCGDTTAVHKEDSNGAIGKYCSAIEEDGAAWTYCLRRSVEHWNAERIIWRNVKLLHGPTQVNKEEINSAYNKRGSLLVSG